MKSVAILGASSERHKFGNKAVRAFLKTGHEVFPVHPTAKEVEGLRCYVSISDLPTRPDIVSAYVNPATLLQLLPAIAAKGCDELWLNPGTTSPEVLSKARSLGLKTVETCSILAVGISPSSL